jgi:lysozyme family protein
MKHEGGYSNHPKDIGGETYKGISRVFNPRWQGFKVIDEAKTTGRSFPDCLATYDELNNKMVPNFYKEKYWDVFWGDGMESQLIANELFDTGVNMGPQRAILFLQRSLNILIYKKGVVTTETLVEDGLFGNKTFTALNTMKPDYAKVLFNLMNLMQGNHYLEYIKKDNRQASFLVGWLKRVEILRK